MKILQLIPPEGWRAVLVSGQIVTLHELAAWALVEEDDGSRRVVGLIADAGGPDPYPATDYPSHGSATNLWGYSPPTDVFDDKFKKMVLNHIEQRTPVDLKRRHREGEE